MLEKRQKLSLLAVLTICLVVFYFLCINSLNDGSTGSLTTGDTYLGNMRLSPSSNRRWSLWNFWNLLRTRSNTETVIAVGGGITSKKLENVSESNIGEKFEFFHTLLPTFCNTASPRFVYRFYLAYDYNDPVFSDERLRSAFRQQFIEVTSASKCQQRSINTDLVLFQCEHADKPAWAQNDAMLEAYLDHADYYYRINDDTKMITDGWTELFISTLDSYNPPRVGVVGPTESVKNRSVLTYEFVHRTHIDIFGFYYPRVFTDWWADVWITRVYQPDRSVKCSTALIRHTYSLGRRHGINRKFENYSLGNLTEDKNLINRYLEAMRSNEAFGLKPDGRKVISMSVYGKAPRYIWGVIRNAQLLPIYLPDWTLRVYVAAESANSELVVPLPIVNKLRLLGAEIVQVPATGSSMEARVWRLLVANDRHIDYFLIREADSRLTDREAEAIRDWVSSAEKNGPQSAVIHCIRDHPKHAKLAIVDGLWGGRPRALMHRVSKELSDIPSMVISTQDSSNLLSKYIWPAVANDAYCHDSVSACGEWTTSRHAFPSPRQDKEYVGQQFDEHEQVMCYVDYQLQPDITCSPMSGGATLT